MLMTMMTTIVTMTLTDLIGESKLIRTGISPTPHAMQSHWAASAGAGLLSMCVLTMQTSLFIQISSSETYFKRKRKDAKIQNAKILNTPKRKKCKLMKAEMQIKNTNPLKITRRTYTLKGKQKRNKSDNWRKNRSLRIGIFFILMCLSS